MPIASFTLFETPIGACGVVWRAGTPGLIGTLLPDSSPQATRVRVRRRFAGAVESRPDAGVQQIATRITALLHGEHDDLADVPLDLHGVPAFHGRVYALARSIPPGATCTYGELAARLPASVRAASRPTAEYTRSCACCRSKEQRWAERRGCSTDGATECATDRAGQTSAGLACSTGSAAISRSNTASRPTISFSTAAIFAVHSVSMRAGSNQPKSSISGRRRPVWRSL